MAKGMKVIGGSDAKGKAAALAAAKKSGLNVRKATGFEAFEKKDKSADKKAGVKEGSKRDMAMDSRASGKRMYAKGGMVKGKC